MRWLFIHFLLTFAQSNGYSFLVIFHLYSSISFSFSLFYVLSLYAYVFILFLSEKEFIMIFHCSIFLPSIFFYFSVEKFAHGILKKILLHWVVHFFKKMPSQSTFNYHCYRSLRTSTATWLMLSTKKTTTLEFSYQPCALDSNLNFEGPDDLQYYTHQYTHTHTHMFYSHALVYLGSHLLRLTPIHSFDMSAHMCHSTFNNSQ